MIILQGGKTEQHNPLNVEKAELKKEQVFLLFLIHLGTTWNGELRGTF